MLKVEFYNCNYESGPPPTYVIIGAQYEGKWIFVKSRKRGSYELPAGHIDKGESDYMAAGRELMEETGAKKFIIECINTYSVTDNGAKQSGKLFYSSILELAEIEDKDEIEECICGYALPENLTFPEVQVSLFGRLEEFVDKS